jgi:hypothetical protein
VKKAEKSEKAEAFQKAKAENEEPKELKSTVPPASSRMGGLVSGLRNRLPTGQAAAFIATGWKRAVTVWRWIIFTLLLGMVFAFIVLWPLARAKLLRMDLAGQDVPAASRAVSGLQALGGRTVEREMVDELITGHEEGRLRALRVLAEVGSVDVLPRLHELKDDPNESSAIRDAAAEALISIQEQ